MSGHPADFDDDAASVMASSQYDNDASVFDSDYAASIFDDNADSEHDSGYSSGHEGEFYWGSDADAVEAAMPANLSYVAAYQTNIPLPSVSITVTNPALGELLFVNVALARYMPSDNESSAASGIYSGTDSESGSGSESESESGSGSESESGPVADDESNVMPRMAVNLDFRSRPIPPGGELLWNVPDNIEDQAAAHSDEGSGEDSGEESDEETSDADGEDNEDGLASYDIMPVQVDFDADWNGGAPTHSHMDDVDVDVQFTPDNINVHVRIAGYFIQLTYQRVRDAGDE